MCRQINYEVMKWYDRIRINTLKYRIYIYNKLTLILYQHD
jgi:hypothetical protein